MRIVVGHPERALGTERDAPAVLQVRIGMGRGDTAIGNQRRRLERRGRRGVVVPSPACCEAGQGNGGKRDGGHGPACLLHHHEQIS